MFIELHSSRTDLIDSFPWDPWNMLYSKLLWNVSATVIYNATVAPLEMNLETAWLSLRYIHIIIIRAELIVTKLDHRLVCRFRNSHHI